MNKTKLAFAIAAAGMMLGSGPLAADADQPFHITGQAGALYTDDDRNSRDDDVWWSLGFGYFITNNFSVDLEYDRFSGTWRDYQEAVPGASFDQWGQTNIGLITNIGSAHNAGFSSQVKKLKEKVSLFKNCKTIIFSTDHDLIKSELKKNYSDKELFSWSKNGMRASVNFRVQNTAQENFISFPVDVNCRCTERKYDYYTPGWSRSHAVPLQTSKLGHYINFYFYIDGFALVYYYFKYINSRELL